MSADLHRRFVSVTINPVNGSIVGVATDGTVWLHDGSPANFAKPWRRLPDVPPNDNPPAPEEPEDPMMV